ncbi:MAG: pyridoxamine 5'-phosphate oxidase family protein [Deltaproteobacteria bacterium]|nr:pyridoxamine 5'-phosphate oxidase family protein [Deltaproteobacteria bacterium]
MKKLFRYLMICSAFGLVLLITQYGISAEKAGGLIKPAKAETKREAMPIDASAKMSPKHPEYDLSMTCAECHPTTLDAISTATTLYINSLKRLERDEVWKRIEAFLPGRERFVLATSYGNRPTATTIDFVLDPVEKVSYAVCEKGTQKLEQIKENPAVSMVCYEGWTVAGGGKKQWKSVQIEGRAEVVDSNGPRFETYLDKYHLVRLSKERAKKRMDILRVVIEKAIFFDSALLKSGFSVYQVWERGNNP